MPASRRYVLAATGAGLTSLAVAPVSSRAAVDEEREIPDQQVELLVRRSLESNAALMRGDIDGYRSLVTLSDDFTLMSPFGGAPTHASEMTGERWQAMGRFFKHGTLRQHLIESYATHDMVVLAIIERAHVEVGGMPPQEWSLRVTLVYRREGAEWLLAHRHADPLVAGINLGHAALLARGEAP